MDESKAQERRAELRKLYEERALKLNDSLVHNESAHVQSQALKDHDVVLTHFDPFKKDQLNSDAFCFKPMTIEKLKSHPPNEYGEDFDPSSLDFADYDPDEDQGIDWGAGRIDDYLKEQIFYIPRMKINRDRGYLSKIAAWNKMESPHPYAEECDSLGGWTEPSGKWLNAGVYEYKSTDGTILPHLRVVTYHPVDGKAGEPLLSELLTLVRAIYLRITQSDKAFKHTSFFPVLMLSFFPRQHGRILHARFSVSGKLHVHMTPIFSFEKKEKAPFDLFVRFIMTTAREDPHLEFADLDRTLESTDLDSKPAQSPPKKRAKTPKSDKENMAPSGKTG